MSIFDFVILIFASYGFATAVQMLRKGRLDYKPYNCVFCLSVWFSFMVSFIYNYISNHNMFLAAATIIYGFAVGGICYLIKIAEDKISGGSNLPI